MPHYSALMRDGSGAFGRDTVVRYSGILFHVIPPSFPLSLVFRLYHLCIKKKKKMALANKKVEELDRPDEYQKIFQ